MGIAVLAEVEKLLKQHGALAMLKEHLKLLERRYSALERQLLDGRQRIARLEEDKQRLVQENLRLTEAMHRVEGGKDTPAQPYAQKIKMSILFLLSEQGGITTDQIAEALGRDRDSICLLLEELETQRLVSARYSYFRPATWRLSQDGRRYLIVNGVLSEQAPSVAGAGSPGERLPEHSDPS